MQQFRPPLNNSAFMAFCKWGLPLELFRARLKVEVAGDGIERFRRLNGRRAVLICNHPDQSDPEVVFTFSKIVGEDFNFIAAREVFDWWLGATGLCFQLIGVYSVVRGEADLESFATSRDIIAHGDRKLVVFPEGEVTRQPDTLLPFRPGATRLFFEGQEELLRTNSTESVLIQPIATRWRYKNDISSNLHRALRKIENRLHIPPSSAALSERIKGAGSAMLTALEHEYRCDNNADQPFDHRVGLLLQCILRRMANLLGVELPESEIHREWLRRVSNTMREYITDDVSSKSRFQQDLHREQAQKMKDMVKDVHRIQHFVGVNGDSVSRPQTQERLASVVAKIELEVLGRISDKGPRICTVGVGEPISLLSFYEDYQHDRIAVIEQTTKLLQSKLQSLVDDLDRQRAPLYLT